VWRAFALLSAAAVGAALAPLVITPAASAAPASPTVWLCRPGLANNPCTDRLTTRVVGANGSRSVQPARPAANPPIDCFYVYPTVSRQPTANANLAVEPAEINVAKAQASRFSQVCRVYAPMYHQLTVAAIAGRPDARITGASETLAYTSLLSAWQDYLAHDNHGRGVVLIGHSQGSAMLIPLIRTQIDANPSVRRRLVSAIIAGGNVTVASGRDVGGDFQHVPACHAATQTGCVIAYSSFLQPPPPTSLFGRVGQGVSLLDPQRIAGPGQSVLCVNPAALGGGTGDLQPYFPTVGGAPLPWVSYPGLYTASCAQSGGATWLQVTDVGGPTDSRPRVTQSLGPTWGLHPDDVNLALGNLVSVVRDQAAAYQH
jgi:hypothetical protein